MTIEDYSKFVINIGKRMMTTPLLKTSSPMVFKEELLYGGLAPQSVSPFQMRIYSFSQGNSDY